MTGDPSLTSRCSNAWVRLFESAHDLIPVDVTPCYHRRRAITWTKLSCPVSFEVGEVGLMWIVFNRALRRSLWGLQPIM